MAMNKAELYARYDNYGCTIEEISNKEYFDVHNAWNPALRAPHEDKIKHHYNGRVEQYEVRTDDAIYMWYSCLHSVGWQGDVEAHSFFCKKKIVTQAEIEKMILEFTETKIWQERIEKEFGDRN